MASRELDKIMAKVTKKMLKSVVKECLVEILSEGIGSDRPGISEMSTSRRRNPTKKKTIFDQMDESFERKPRASDNITFGSKVSQIASAATSDPVLQSILEDTAKTTLQDQLQHESNVPTAGNMISSPSPHSLSSGGPSGLDIDSLFGEATKNWGELMERTERKPL